MICVPTTRAHQNGASSAGKDHNRQKRVSTPKYLFSTCVLQETGPAVERISSVTQQEASGDLAFLNHMESGARVEVLGASDIFRERGGKLAEKSIKLLYYFF